jgi:hypothetical protein
MESFSNFSSDLFRDAFHEDSKSAGVLRGFGIVHDTFRIALNNIAAECMDALWTESDMGHNGDSRIDHRSDSVGLSGTPFEFDSMAAGSFHDFSCRSKGVLDSELPVGEGKIDKDEGSFSGSSHHFSMVNHVGEGYWEGCFMALNHHSETIANQEHIHPSFIEKLSGREVVGCQHGDRLVSSLHFLKVSDRKLFLRRRVGHIVSAGDWASLEATEMKKTGDKLSEAA